MRADIVVSLSGSSRGVNATPTIPSTGRRICVWAARFAIRRGSAQPAASGTEVHNATVQANLPERIRDAGQARDHAAAHFTFPAAPSRVRDSIFIPALRTCIAGDVSTPTRRTRVSRARRGAASAKCRSARRWLGAVCVRDKQPADLTLRSAFAISAELVRTVASECAGDVAQELAAGGRQFGSRRERSRHEVIEPSG